MIKMVHILYSGLGGHGAVLFALLEHKFFDSAEHSVVFIGVEKPRSEYVARCEALSVPWSYVPRIKTKSYLSFVVSLTKKLLLIDPDTVFSHGLAATLSLTLLQSLSSRKRFFVLRETQAHHLKGLRDWILLLAANCAFDRIVYLTEEAKIGAKSKLRFFGRDKKSIVIGNGLDTDYFSRDAPAGSAKLIKIGMQSRLQANKDHRTLIDAFNILRTTQSNLNISLHIAGDGDTLSSLKGYVESLGLTHKVFFHGMLGQNSLRNFLSDLSVYVHCTHGETMSTAIMQALSMGLPVIASDVWGVSNMIKDGNGMLHRPGDASDLAEKINRVMHDERLAISLSAKARQGAVENYSNAVLVEKYNIVFNE